MVTTESNEKLFAKSTCEEDLEKEKASIIEAIRLLRNADESVRAMCEAREEALFHEQYVQNQLKELQGQLNKKDTQLSEIDAQIAKKDSILSEKDAEIAKKDALIKQLESKIAELKASQ